MTRIVAHASVGIMSDRPGSRLATVRALPGMATVRSVVFWGSDGLRDQLTDAWAELRDGLFLVSVGTAAGWPDYFAVEVEDGRMVSQEPLSTDEARDLPRVVSALLASGDLDGQGAGPAPVV